MITPPESPNTDDTPADEKSARAWKRIPVVNDYCVGCGNCVDACPEGTLRTILDVAVVHRPDTCISCDACIPVCNDDAIHMHWIEMDGRKSVGDWRSDPPPQPDRSFLAKCWQKLFGKS